MTRVRTTCVGRGLAVLLVSWMTACDDSTGVTSCAEVPRLAVSTGSAPTFTWTGDCTPEVFVVYDLTTGFALWHIEPQTQRIRSPVTYGIVQPGTRQLHAPEALQAGTQYGLFLEWVVGTHTTRGTVTFTP